ncbi:Nn.00g024320.m01.CDS01 [Neocucurbitaria sp. VM-36]
MTRVSTLRLPLPACKIHHLADSQVPSLMSNWDHPVPVLQMTSILMEVQLLRLSVPIVANQRIVRTPLDSVQNGSSVTTGHDNADTIGGALPNDATDNMGVVVSIDTDPTTADGVLDLQLRPVVAQTSISTFNHGPSSQQAYYVSSRTDAINDAPHQDDWKEFLNFS